MIIVTGTSSGIGLEIAKFLVGSGHKVTGVSRRKTDFTSPLFSLVQGDVTDPKVVSELAAIPGPIEGVVFNHGVLEPVATIADSSPEEWKKAMDINFFSIVAITKALLPKLREAHARVIFVSSGAATSFSKTWGSYGATKAALNHFAQTLSSEEPDLIPIAVAPGVVNTAMQSNIRNVHVKAMGPLADRFINMHANNELVDPKDSGKLFGNLVLAADKDLRGKVLRYSDEVLAKYSK